MSPPALSTDEQKPSASSDSSVEDRFADFCKVLGDVIESLAGAIFVDSGTTRTLSFEALDLYLSPWLPQKH